MPKKDSQQVSTKRKDEVRKSICHRSNASTSAEQAISRALVAKLREKINASKMTAEVIKLEAMQKRFSKLTELEINEIIEKTKSHRSLTFNTNTQRKAQEKKYSKKYIAHHKTTNRKTSGTGPHVDSKEV